MELIDTQIKRSYKGGYDSTHIDYWINRSNANALFFNTESVGVFQKVEKEFTVPQLGQHVHLKLVALISSLAIYCKNWSTKPLATLKKKKVSHHFIWHCPRPLLDIEEGFKPGHSNNLRA